MIARTVEAFVAHGFEEDDARTRVRLIDDVQRAHETLAGRAPAWSWFTPGRVEILGKHTDYAGGRSLIAAVPRGFAIAASAREDDQIRVLDAGTHDLRAMSLAGAQRQQHGWLNYVAAVVRRLTLNFPGSRLGADLTLKSDLPRASGMSSSSALVVGVATALIRRAGLAEAGDWRRAIRTPLDLAGYLGALERGAAFGSLEGTSAVGVFGGSEDHTAILMCKPGEVSAYQYQPVRLIGEAPMPREWRFILVSSGVVADKAGTVREAYNRASLATVALVAAWNDRFAASHGVLADALASALDEPRVLELFRQSLPLDLQRRVDHFLAEDARIPAALDAFRRGDTHALGELSAASQRDAESLLENQTVETTALVRQARALGAFAGSSFGGGFGGAVWAMAPAGDAPAFAEQWMAGYRAQFPDRREAACFTARPSPGLVEVASSQLLDLYRPL